MPDAFFLFVVGMLLIRMTDEPSSICFLQKLQKKKKKERKKKEQVHESMISEQSILYLNYVSYEVTCLFSCSWLELSRFFSFPATTLPWSRPYTI
ncbi:hypothetical protein HanIR_Chr08g0367441 [Helianthus annuus]|nr:hypothetical protein HanIR_Chr08g0367441 [Helianthus annuus]